MTIRFSAARRGTNPAVARALCLTARLDAANENPRAPADAAPTPEHRCNSPLDMPIIPEALRHFARHGLSAALQARLKAEAANAVGDAVACGHWLAICRQFDRRMADATAHALRRQR